MSNYAVTGECVLFHNAHTGDAKGVDPEGNRESSAAESSIRRSLVDHPYIVNRL
jgi:hypothetical protein